jgi:hypothetical protein
MWCPLYSAVMFVHWYILLMRVCSEKLVRTCILCPAAKCLKFVVYLTMQSDGVVCQYSRRCCAWAAARMAFSNRIGGVAL